jgi:hypothetical protein
MLDELRRPFFVAALIAWLLVVLVEVGSSFLPACEVTQDELLAAIVRDQPGEDPPSNEDLQNMIHERQTHPPRPGFAITALVAFDAWVLVSMFWMGAGLVISRRLVGRAQGISSSILALIAIIAGIVAASVLFALLLMMIGLLLAPPFGTMAYLAIWGFFARGPAAVTLGILLLLKIGGSVLLLLAQQNFIKNVRLVILILFSLLLTVLVSVLHGFAPLVVVSITDTLAALLIVIVAVLWAILVLIGGLVATIKAIPPEKTSS